MHLECIQLQKVPNISKIKNKHQPFYYQVF